MKLTVFRAGKGDCLLLTTEDDKRMLIDGGMRADYNEHVAPTLAQLAAQEIPLDVVYVSHIDRDHISGVLQLMDDLVAWRVYRYQRERGNERAREPKRPRPPEVHNLWHNGFGELVKSETTPIEDTLAMEAGLLETSDVTETLENAAGHRELATSVAEGIELSRRAAGDQLGIPLNKPFGGELACVEDGARPVTLGTARFTLIGPHPEDLEKLRGEWQDWLRDKRDQHERLKARMQRDSDRLATEFDRLRAALDFDLAELGQRAKVTIPNLASLMFLVEEGERSVLLTGDGHHADVLKGLERAGRLQPGGSIHVDVLKVPHHGSEHNLDPDFAKRVTADRYLFCANGEHKNPDERIVQAIIDSRRDDKRQYHLDFNSSSAAIGADQEHMRKIEELVTTAANGSNRRIHYEFLEKSSFELTL